MIWDDIVTKEAMDELASARQDELALHAIHMHPKKIAWS